MGIGSWITLKTRPFKKVSNLETDPTISFVCLHCGSQRYYREGGEWRLFCKLFRHVV